MDRNQNGLSIVSRRPTYAMLEPYLSLNRTSIFLPLNTSDEKKMEKKEAIAGLRKLPYALPQEDAIVVDDLYPGFSIIEGEKGRGLRINAREDKKRSTDRGLTITSVNSIPTAWSRLVNIGNSGKYRHTLAVVRAGQGEKKAVFTTVIHRSDKWDLELFIPWKKNLWPGRKWGTYNLVVTDGNGDQHEIAFDSKAASLNWNLAKSLNLAEGETSVTISDKTDGRIVVADAIRWTPAAE